MATKVKVLTGKDLKKSNDELIQEIEQKYFETPEPEFLEPQKEITETELLSEELQKAYREIETLKSRENKNLLMDFEEAAKLFKQKAKMLDEISHLEAVKNKISDINFSENSDNGLESYYYNIGLLYTNRSEPIFKTSNLFVIEEFLQFIHIKIVSKIDELKFKVQEL